MSSWRRNSFFPIDFLWWYVDTLPEALVCSLIGILVFILSLHALNGLAWIWRELASLMLGTKVDVTPAVPGDLGPAGDPDPADDPEPAVVSDSTVPA